MQRRDILRLGTAAALAAPLTQSVSADEPRSRTKDARRQLDWNRSLVLIELKGGNDGLNTIVPYTDKDYYKHRPNVAVGQDRVLRLSPQLGFHPLCEPLMQSWKDQELAVVLGTGYAKPNRSHFRGIDIWHGGTDATEIAQDGWLARLLDDARAVQQPEDLLAHGIVWGHQHTVGHAGLGPLFGRQLELLVMNRPQEFLRRAKTFNLPAGEGLTPAHAHILKANQDLVTCAKRMQSALAKGGKLKGTFPRNNFARHLQQTAQLIAGGAKVPVYKLTLDGFDTHAGQVGRHERLLSTLAGGLGAFRTALQAANCWDRTLVMTYSEFGRRVGGNNSAGTDHGTAAPHFYMGGKVKGGFYGKQPTCSKLQGGDLIATVDYRSLYTTVSQNWWGYKDSFLKRQSSYRAIPLIKS